VIQIRQTVSIKSKFESGGKEYSRTLEKSQMLSAKSKKIFKEMQKIARKSETAPRKFGRVYFNFRLLRLNRMALPDEKLLAAELDSTRRMLEGRTMGAGQ
jgi:hypothetical protein